MLSRGRRLQLLLGLIVATLTVPGCTSHTSTTPATSATTTHSTPPSSRDASGQALVFHEQTSSYELPVRRGERISDGTVLIANSSAEPIRITHIDLDFGAGDDTGIRVLGHKIVPLTNSDEKSVGVLRASRQVGELRPAGKMP